MELLIAAIIGYLLGSIPFGLILTKLAGHGDIRAIGSGNIGATNVLRTGNKKLAALTLLLDMAKGAVAAYIWPLVYNLSADNFHDSFPNNLFFILFMTAGFFALIGHMFPVWLKFKGGKGVATGLGVLLALYWPVGLLTAATWIITAFLFRISSLAAIIAAALAPVYALFLANISPFPWFCLACSILIIGKHHTNIRRLIKGEEPKIGKKKDTTDEHR